MIRTALICVLLLYFLSCKRKVTIPENVLPPQKMEAVMTDMMRADEYINQQGIVDSLNSITLRRVGLYQQIFQFHKVNKKQLQSSLRFYQNHPDLLKIVIDSMHSKTSRISIPIIDSAKVTVPKK